MGRATTVGVGTATLSAQNSTQDAGIFVNSHAGGTPAQAVFDGLTDGATPPPPGPKLYEAESSANTIVGRPGCRAARAARAGRRLATSAAAAR